jgi:ribulose-phosphate 3-epimerase
MYRPSAEAGDRRYRWYDRPACGNAATDGRKGWGLTTNRVLIGPSILSADFRRLGEQVAAVEAAGADFIHVDVMDGVFVPNISVGFPILEAVRASTTLPIDVHLMIVQPARWVERFAVAGADTITVHVEVDPNLYRTLRAIDEAGATPSVTLNPGTSLMTLEPVIPIVRQVLIMSVNPGFGGQTFIPASLERIRRVRDLINQLNPGCRLEVDGGIKASNAQRVVEAGADTLVAGSAVYADGNIDAAMRALMTAVGRTPQSDTNP